ncbi:hypothetical protein GCM10007881_55370 [Mesorhizobium huakuii]|nr:hypothetical protein GCM10007881_55370 [Mesorhizobium huakuii]
MSNKDKYDDFVAVMNFWKGEIQGDNDLFKNGWTIESLKKKIRDTANKYGDAFAESFGVKGG